MKGILRDLFDGFVHWALLMVALLVLAGFSAAAHAATGTTALTFTPPTTNSDGSALAASDITNYTVVCTFTPPTGAASTCVTDTTTIAGGTNKVGTLKITYPVSGGQACILLKTNRSDGVQGAGSQPPACTTLPAIKPNDPTNVTITVTLAINLQSDSPITVAAVTPVVQVSP